LDHLNFFRISDFEIRASLDFQSVKINRVVVENCLLRFIAHIVAREKFRHHSYFSDIAVGCIVGLGALGYELAIQAAAARLQK